MDILRCAEEHIRYALAAIRVVKNEEDHNPIGLVTPEAMRLFLSNPDNYLLIAVEENEVIGYLIAYALQRVDRKSKMLFFYEIGVLKKARRKGIGTALIGYMKEICKKNEYMKIWVLTERSNNAVMRLYEKTGGEISESNDEVSFTWYPPYETVH